MIIAKVPDLRIFVLDQVTNVTLNGVSCRPFDEHLELSVPPLILKVFATRLMGGSR
jgi:hypothetical protein